MYKWLILNALVQRLADGAFIPVDPRNKDWNDVLAWVAAGNVIADADPPPQLEPPRDPLAEIDALKAALTAKAVITEADIDAASVSLGKAVSP